MLTFFYIYSITVVFMYLKLYHKVFEMVSGLTKEELLDAGAELLQSGYPGFGLILLTDFNFSETKVTRIPEGYKVECGDDLEGRLIKKLLNKGFHMGPSAKRTNLVKNRDIDYRILKDIYSDKFFNSCWKLCIFTDYL